MEIPVDLQFLKYSIQPHVAPKTLPHSKSLYPVCFRQSNGWFELQQVVFSTI